MTNARLAKLHGVSRSTIIRWRKAHAPLQGIEATKAWASKRRNKSSTVDLATLEAGLVRDALAMNAKNE